MERARYQILRALQKETMSFWELIRFQDSTLAEFTRTIGLMLSENQIVFDSGSRRFSLEKPPETRAGDNDSCPTCQGKGLTLDGPRREALERFLELTKDRPLPVFEYNQGIIDPPDLALKSVFMDRRGDLGGRSILLIGDDDLFSIFLALLGFDFTLTVLEIDDRLIRYIKEKAERHSLAITTQRYDVNAPLPHDLAAAFDAFVTEPPEGLKGMLLFLERAVEALNTRGAGYFGLTTMESSLPKWLSIQRFLLEKGVVITDLLRNFSLYPEAGDPIEDYEEFPISREFPVTPGPPDVDYFASSLIRVEKTDRDRINETEGFYTDEDTWVTVNPEGGE
jgi:predicted methyltransferase